MVNLESVTRNQIVRAILTAHRVYQNAVGVEGAHIKIQTQGHVTHALRTSSVKVSKYNKFESLH